MNSNRERIADAIRYIPADDRDLWVRMGMAIKAELGEDGFDLWDDWSRQDESYRERDARGVWKSVRANGGITAGTLFEEAKRHGYKSANGASRPPPHRRTRAATPDNSDDAARRQRAATAAAAAWDKAKPAPDDHAYLVAKGIKAHGIRMARGLLMVPARDASGNITTLQTISGSGEKLFLKDGAVGGSFYMIGEPDGRVLIAEGFATAATLYEALGIATVVGFNAGNLLAVAKTIRAQYPDVGIIVCADDDAGTAGNPGLTKATKAALAVGALLAVPVFGDARPEGATDFNDLARHRGRDAVAACVSGATSPPGAEDVPPQADPAPDRLAAVLARAFTFIDAKVTTSVPYVLKGVFGRGQLIVFWGKPGSGKTFATMELVGHIGAGANYHGRRTRRGAVLYVAAESARVYTENRIAALKERHPELAHAAVVVLPIGLDLLHEDAGDVEIVIGAVRKLEPDYGEFALVVVDTLAVTFGGGNENAPEDMGAYVGNILRIVRDTGVAVLLVHHCGKDEARGMRGHSALLGALDAELAIEGDGDVRMLRTGKVREGDAYADLFSFRLERVELGDDDDGDPVTTCVVTRCDPAAGRPATAMPKSATLALRCLEEAIQEHGAPLPMTSAIPAGTKAVRMTIWRDRYNLRDGVAADEPDAKKAKDARDKRFERARLALLNAGKVGSLGEFVWLN